MKIKRLHRLTRRLLIRPLLASDYQVWKTAYSAMPEPGNTWDLQNHTPERLTSAAFRQVLQLQKKNGDNDTFYNFGVFHRHNKALVGVVSIMDLSRGIFQNAYLGYRIFNIYWGQGFGAEAATAALDIAFADLHLHRIEAGIAPQNRRSLRLARAIGLRKEGKSLRRLFLDGKWQDLMIYAVTSEELGFKWAPSRQGRDADR